MLNYSSDWGRAIIIVNYYVSGGLSAGVPVDGLNLYKVTLLLSAPCPILSYGIDRVALH